MCFIFACSRWLHLLFNLGVQVVVGLPLEMVHGSLRIAAVYMAGVLAGKFPQLMLLYSVYTKFLALCAFKPHRGPSRSRRDYLVIRAYISICVLNL